MYDLNQFNDKITMLNEVFEENQFSYDIKHNQKIIFSLGKIKCEEKILTI